MIKEKAKYKEVILPIRADVENKLVFVGNAKYDEFDMNFDKDDCLVKNDKPNLYREINPPTEHMKKFEKAKCRGVYFVKNYRWKKIYGAKAKGRFQEAMYDVWIDPEREATPLFNRLCMDRPANKINRKNLSKWQDVKPLIIQAEKDNIPNVSPLIFFLGKNPQELRLELGKGLWRKLSKNSFTKNLYLSQICESLSNRVSSRQCLTRLSPCKTFTLKRIRNEMRMELEEMDAILYVDRQAVTSLTPREMDRERNIFTDTKRMLEGLGHDFNKNWSKSRMHKEHARAMKLNKHKKYKEPDKRFGIMNRIDLSLVSNEDFEVRSLSCISDYIDEAIDMHHCIDSYIGKAKSGGYFAISVSRIEDSKRATCGFFVDEDFNFSFNQAYHSNNDIIQDTDYNEFMKKLTTSIEGGKIKV